MCGPFCFYTDYLAFINGTSYTSYKPTSNSHTSRCVEDNGQGSVGQKPVSVAEQNNCHNADGKREPPSPAVCILHCSHLSHNS